MRKCFERTGAFEMLILHNAAMLSNLMIATEDVSNIPFVTGVISDPDLDTYTYQNPCPDTTTRIANYNAYRTSRGESVYNGIPSIASVPANLLKLALPQAVVVKVEDHAYALSDFEV